MAPRRSKRLVKTGYDAKAISRFKKQQKAAAMVYGASEQDAEKWADDAAAMYMHHFRTYENPLNLKGRDISWYPERPKERFIVRPQGATEYASGIKYPPTHYYIQDTLTRRWVKNSQVGKVGSWTAPKGKGNNIAMFVLSYHAEEAAKELNRITAYENPSKKGKKNPDGNGRGDSLYQRFHGNPPTNHRTVNLPMPPPGTKLIAIGELARLEYRPPGNSKHKGIQFFHDSGDLGGKTIKVKTLLVTDEEGKNIYILPQHPEYPKFDKGGRGILG